MIHLPRLPRPNEVSVREILKALGKAILITLGLAALLAVTIVWALASVAITLIASMVEQFTQPGPSISKRNKTGNQVA